MTKNQLHCGRRVIHQLQVLRKLLDKTLIDAALGTIKYIIFALPINYSYKSLYFRSASAHFFVSSLVSIQNLEDAEIVSTQLAKFKEEDRIRRQLVSLLSTMTLFVIVFLYNGTDQTFAPVALCPILVFR